MHAPERLEVPVPTVPEAVWITLHGEHVHTSADCTGILDGHAKAEREGKGTHEPELWPVRLAASGYPRGDRTREPCDVCLPGAHMPSAGRDNPAFVETTKAGTIVAAWRSYLVQQDKQTRTARAARWADQQEDVPPSMPPA